MPMRMQSVARPSRIVRTVTREARSTDVGADVRVTQRLPPGEPGVSARSAAPGDYDEIGNHQQQDEEPDRHENAGPQIHCSAPLDAAMFTCNLWSVPVHAAEGVTYPFLT